MKNKSLILLVVCLTLACSIFLSACGSGTITDAREVNMLDVLAEEPADSITFTSLSALTLEGDFVAGAGNFFYTKKERVNSIVYTFYDVRTLDSICTFTNQKDATENIFTSAGFYPDADFFTVTSCTEDKFTTQLIYKNATVIATEDGAIAPSFSTKLFDAYGLFTFAGDAYRQTDKGVSLVREDGLGYTTFADSSVLFCGNKYFWVDFPGSVSKHVVAFNTELNPVTEYKFPSYATNSQVYPLANDRILIQYTVAVDSHTIEHDFVMNGTKYDIYQFVLNTEAKSLTAIDLKGVVLSCETEAKSAPDLSAPYDAMKKGRISAYASIAPITDHNINLSAREYFNINDAGAVVEKFIPPQNLDEINIQIIARDRYVLENKYLGATQVINKGGKVYGAFDNYDENMGIFSYTGNINDSFIIAGGVIYNYDFKKIYEIKSNDEVILAQHSIYIKSYDENRQYYDFFLLKAGDEALGEPIMSYTENSNTQLILEETAIGGAESIREYIYCIRSEKGDDVSYNYYYENGTAMATVSDAPLTSVFVAFNAKTVILSKTTSSGTEYFVLK